MDRILTLRVPNLIFDACQEELIRPSRRPPEKLPQAGESLFLHTGPFTFRISRGDVALFGMEGAPGGYILSLPEIPYFEMVKGFGWDDPDPNRGLVIFRGEVWMYVTAQNLGPRLWIRPGPLEFRELEEWEPGPKPATKRPNPFSGRADPWPLIPPAMECKPNVSADTADVYAKVIERWNRLVADRADREPPMSDWFDRLYGHCALACDDCKIGFVQAVQRPKTPGNAVCTIVTCPVCERTIQTVIPLIDLISMEEALSRAKAITVSFYEGSAYVDGISTETVIRSREEKEKGRTVAHEQVWGEMLAAGDDKVQAACDCYARKCGPPHALWCSTRK